MLDMIRFRGKKYTARKPGASGAAQIMLLRPHRLKLALF